MNKVEFQANRTHIKSLFTLMFNEMHNMYDKLEDHENKIEHARQKGYEQGHADGLDERIAKILEQYIRTDESELSYYGKLIREKIIEGVKPAISDYAEDIDRARSAGWQEGYNLGRHDGLVANVNDLIDGYIVCDESELSESGILLRKKIINAVKNISDNDKEESIPVTWIENIIAMSKKVYADKFAESLELMIEDWREEQKNENKV